GDDRPDLRRVRELALQRQIEALWHRRPAQRALQRRVLERPDEQRRCLYVADRDQDRRDSCATPCGYGRAEHELIAARQRQCDDWLELDEAMRRIVLQELKIAR